jgi:plasmid replication initiation protein
MSQKQMIVRPNPDNVVRKAEKLLKARYTLSQLAIKIITSVISMISKDDADFQLYVLKITDFKELLNDQGKLGGKEYKAFKDACNELMNKKIEFDEGEDVGFFITRWAASVEYFAGSGEVEIEISQKLRPLLLQLKEGNYLNYELKNILKLKSTYLIRLYELLKHEFNKVKRYKPNTTAVIHEIDIEQLRKDFQIPDSYQYSSGIKLRIFDKAVKQFKEHTDIEISYKPSKKRGKKVLAVEFTIRENDGLADYLKDLRSFIAYMRKNFVNQDIWQGQGMILSVDEKGRIYNKLNLKEYNKNDAKKVWETWYELAKQNKFRILKQGKLF